MKTTAILLASLILAQGSTFAQDKEGAKDHPILKRYQDSFIFQYSRAAYAPYKLGLGKGLNPAAPASYKKTSEREEMLEGRVTRLSYLAPAGRSGLEVFRNYEQELKDKGFTTLFKGELEELGYRFGSRYEGVFGQIFEYNDDGNRYIAAKLERPEGNITVAIYVSEYSMGLTGGLRPIKGQPVIQVDIIEDKPMDERMVVVSAEKMATSIETTGRIALYGITFDFNKADIKAESTPTLEQMAKLLRTIPTMKLLVVGHTDNVGGFDYNMNLSGKRAFAVVDELSGRYGIDARRLTPMGASFMAPVASNRTEDGRAKNRRVELVEQ
jgi:outer membrane protein OmpA-like peptidoglycan-associated protein